VSIAIRDSFLLVEGETLHFEVPLALLRQAPAARGPLTLWFPDGGRAAITDRAAFARLLAASPGAAIAVSQWDSSARPVLAPAVVVLLVVAALLFGAYRYLIPVVSEAVAERLPASVATSVSESTLAALEREALSPSRLSPLRQAELARGFEELHPGARNRYRLLFRRSEQLGPNAMALPSGTIVVTDELVALAGHDHEILGVLAHEAGHVDKRHGLRLFVQGSLVTLVASWVVGDYGSIAAAAPSALLQAKYSRDFEREADAYAADLMLARGIPPSALADMLERIDRAARNSAEEAAEEPGAVSMLDYAASHPATTERLAYLRERR
jgi:Zn-dependent protease with chaperone function